MTTPTRRSAFRLPQAADAAKMLIARWRMFAVRPGPCLVPAQRQQCAPCSGDEQCAEGFQCARPQTGRPEACLQVCEKDDDCSEGQCGDGLCRSSDGCGRGSDLCKPCVTDVECGSQSDFCVRNLVSGQRHCASACEDADDCPAGFLCHGLRWRSSMCAIRWSLRGAMLGG